MKRTTVTLTEVLDAREDRARRQREMLAAHGLPLLSCTLNTPGAVKDSPLIRRFFSVHAARIKETFADKIRASEIRFEKTGPHFLAAADESPETIKRICVGLEEAYPAGRLLDLDVIAPNGASLSRRDLGFPERNCLVCGRPGRACAAGQRHSYEELTRTARDLMTAFFAQTDPETLAEWATDALIREVHVTPKPGLVDENNNGSHRDMDLPLMEKSARALTGYFEACVRIGMETANRDPDTTFPYLRAAGLDAEKAMFAATGGVNTHKGAIYLFGILLGAAGRLWKADALPAGNAVPEEGGRIAKKAVKEDLESIANLPEDKWTAGQRLFRDYGMTGARGEAMEGFPALRETALPYLAAHRGEKDAPARVLLHLIARGTDTNLFARGGKEKADRAVKAVRTLLAKGEPEEREIRRLDEDFIRENLSPGGSADLLAAALFCERLNEQDL